MPPLTARTTSAGFVKRKSVLNVLRILVRLAGLLDRHDIRLDARRRDLQQELLAHGVLRDLVAAAHDAVAARDLRPDRCDLTVNETVVNAAECDFHKNTPFTK